MDIKRKLTSRKFWLALIGFITPIMTLYKVPTETATQITAIIMAGGTLIAYILAEGFTDAQNIASPESLDVIEAEEDEE